MHCPKCGKTYHGNAHNCKCGTENPYQVAKSAVDKANNAIALANVAIGKADDAIRIAEGAKEEAGNHRKQIAISTGIVTGAGGFALGVYQATEHDYALYGVLFCSLLVAIGIVALIWSYVQPVKVRNES